MKKMMPKDFIQQVLINELGILKDSNPYVSFALMAIGIEFLGKCLNTHNSWNQSGRSKADFELAINDLNSFSSYRPLLSSHKLWDSLRNGFAHSFVPKGPISLSSKSEEDHLIFIGAKVNLKCEDLYSDFKNACNEVLSMNTFPNTKMSNSLMVVPDPTSSGNSGSEYSGDTAN